MPRPICAIIPFLLFHSAAHVQPWRNDAVKSELRSLMTDLIRGTRTK